MIKIENVEVMGWEHAIRGMRNPKNSWEKSDSYEAVDCGACGRIDREGSCTKEGRDCTGFECYAIGPNDHKLMTSLAKGGPVHAKYRRMITVYLDITAPLYWWKEFDTYKVGTVANSCSTMHKIADKEFTIEDFSCEHLLRLKDLDDMNEIPSIDVSSLRDGSELFSPYGVLKHIIIRMLNVCREKYLVALRTEEECGLPAKDIWWQMIQLLPTSYNQKRTIMLNYEVLVGMYESRKNHKLDEWREFCKWIESLPYSELITGGEKNDNSEG